MVFYTMNLYLFRLAIFSTSANTNWWLSNRWLKKSFWDASRRNLDSQNKQITSLLGSSSRSTNWDFNFWSTPLSKTADSKKFMSRRSFWTMKIFELYISRSIMNICQKYGIQRKRKIEGSKQMGKCSS